jgi:hypothetical protein
VLSPAVRTLAVEHDLVLGDVEGDAVNSAPEVVVDEGLHLAGRDPSA